MKKILTVIVVVVIIAAGYYIYQKSSTKTSSFTDSHNFYSIEYPLGWTVNGSVQGGDVDVFESPDKVVQMQIIKGTEGIAAFANALMTNKMKSEGIKKVAGYDAEVYSLEIPEAKKYVKVWYVKIPTGTATVYLIVSISSNKKSDGEEIIKTIKIRPRNSLKIIENSKKAEEIAQKNSQDAAIKALLAALRAQAEIYYEKNNSYANLCVDSTIKNLLGNIKTTEKTCKDTKSAYAISAKLLMNGYFCVDSTGAAKGTSFGIQSTSCTK